MRLAFFSPMVLTLAASAAYAQQPTAAQASTGTLTVSVESASAPSDGGAGARDAAVRDDVRECGGYTEVGRCSSTFEGEAAQVTTMR